MRRVLLVFVAVAMSALTACGSADDGVPGAAAPEQETSNGGGNESGSTDESGTDNGGSGSSGNSEPPASLSDDFAVGIAPGWVFDVLGDIGMTNTTGAQLYYPEGAFDEVVAYYDDWTSSQSVEYARTEIDGDVIYQSMETPVILITVTPAYEERGETYTYLLIAGGEDG